MYENSAYANKLEEHFTPEQVALWAKDQLGFTDDEAEAIRKEKLSGRALLVPCPVKSVNDLVDLLPSVPRGKLRQMLMAIEDSATMLPLQTKINATLPTKTMEIPARDPRFTFQLPSGRLTIGGWKQVKSAPFYNRQNTLLVLLNDVYRNYTNSHTKPVHALTVAAPGFGKTRLLVEWAIQVFHQDDVLFSFLFGWKTVSSSNFTLSQLVLTKNSNERKDLHHLENSQSEQFESRLHFIAQLHRTLKQGRVISCSASVFQSEDSAQICATIIKNAIADQFGLAVESTDISSLYETYQNLVSKRLYEPVFQGIKVEDRSLENRPITLINIDEIQAVKENCSLAHDVLNNFVNINSSKTFTPTHIFMVGLNTGKLDSIEDRTYCSLHLNFPLEPLHKIEYLDSLCSMTLKHYFLDRQPVQNEIGQLAQPAREVLVTLWIRTLGIPRAIEYLFHCISKNQALLTAPKMSTDAKVELLSALQISAQEYFVKTKGLYYAPPGISPDDWQKICAEAVLCLPKDPTTFVGQTDKTYAELEASGSLLPFLFDVNQDLTKLASRLYTLPFYFYPDLKDFKLKLLASSANHTRMIPWEPSLLDIIGATDYNSLSGKGDVLEHAVASSLWLRYRLSVDKPGEFVEMSQVIKNWSSKTVYYLSLNGLLQVPIGIDPLTIQNRQQSLQWLEETQAIIINKQKASFADVLVPLFEKKDDKYLFACMLGIQCRNVMHNAKQTKPFNLYAEIQKFNLSTERIIWMLMAPNTSTKPLSVRLKEQGAKAEAKTLEDAGKIVLSNGDDWLSPLFLTAFRKAYGLRIQVQTEEKSSTKRKEDQMTAPEDIELLHEAKKQKIV